MDVVVSGQSELFAELGSYGASLVFEAAGQTGAVDDPPRPLDDASVLVGPAGLVRCAWGDNLELHRAIARAQQGEVLVVDAGGNVQAAQLGEIMTVAAQVRGIAGVVIDGAVRDSQAIVKPGFPVFARGLTVRAAAKAAPAGAEPAEVILGGCSVHSGDIVVADRDGIVIVPAMRLQEIVDSARQRMERERAIIAGLKQGKTTLELFGLA
jgi:4-hydroxy-4-methyl-2-oxoglutarate aldolase